VNSVEEISTLSEKVDALMELVASKNAPIDPNDVPLSTLTEQNNDPVDVNFVSRNNLIVMLIEVISILNRFQEIPLTIMAIPMVIVIVIIIGCPLILIIISKNFLMLKKFSTL
jgi:hypothetical protein